MKQYILLLSVFGNLQLLVKLKQDLRFAFLLEFARQMPLTFKHFYYAKRTFILIKKE